MSFELGFDARGVSVGVGAGACGNTGNDANVARTADALVAASVAMENFHVEQLRMENAFLRQQLEKLRKGQALAGWARQ